MIPLENRFDDTINLISLKDSTILAILPCSLKSSEFYQPYLAFIPILYPLKTPENRWLPGVFRVYKTGTCARNKLKQKADADT